MKKFLSLLLCVCLASSGVYAAPSAIDVVESSGEVWEDTAFDSTNDASTQDDSSQADNSDTDKVKSPSPVDVVTTSKEIETDDKPESADDALLMLDIYDDGDGSESSPYEISDKDQLVYFAQTVNQGSAQGKHYLLTADIDLEGTTWEPVGYYSESSGYSAAFSGSFDGGNHTISNFKITSASTPYIGFFGSVYNGKIKNLTLDGVDINVFCENQTESYVGSLIGRLNAIGENQKSEVTNCKILNATVTAKANFRLYTAGVIGFALSDAGTEISVSNVYADCDVISRSRATEHLKDPDNPKKLIYSRGVSAVFMGYVGALTNGTLTIHDIEIHGSAETVNTEASQLGYSNVAHTFASGVFGQLACYKDSEVGGQAFIHNISSDASVTATGKFILAAGGFAASISCADGIRVYDCYSSGDVTSKSENDYTSVGGFTGQLDYGATVKSGKAVSNCYSSGNVYDVSATSFTESYGGGFVGYSTEGTSYSNCYKLAGKDVDVVNVTNDVEEIAEGSQTNPASYKGFDFVNVWTINSEAEYPYPTLLTDTVCYVTFVSEGMNYHKARCGENGKITLPASPVKASTSLYNYTFSHWSLTQGGEAFDFENTLITEPVTLYAVFNEQDRIYTVTFISDSKEFDVKQSTYGQTISLPDNTPSKPDGDKYRYTFSHWSASDSGSAFDFESYTVTGNKYFYAVFTEIDKSAWSGTVATKFAEGHGTAALPYIIASPSELALLQKLVNEGVAGYAAAHYRLDSDIHLGYNIWQSIGTADNPFTGTFDGNGYSIAYFSLGTDTYMGLFGHIKGATVKNIYLHDFEADITLTERATHYIGSVAGLATSSNESPVLISGIQASPSKFKVTAQASTLYAGGIAGHLISAENTYKKADIENSFFKGNISVTNNGSYSYIGGIAGYVKSYARVVATVNSCYSTGKINSRSEGLSYVGGIAGFIWSYGSAYSPEVPIGDGSLAADPPADALVYNCFTVMNVTHAARLNSSGAGFIIGGQNNDATVDNCFYDNNINLEVTGGKEVDCGVMTFAAFNEKFVGGTIGFDVENTWTYISSNEFPVLKIMYTEKPIFRISDIIYDESTLSAKVSVLSSSDNCTVIFGVYNKDGKLAAIRRTKVINPSGITELDFEFENVKNVKRIAVSVIETRTFRPLFAAKEYDI